ncbi:hypothetical protein [Risungbinella massiliensis]|uniref:hypothetical protein n=1 Tax=Risungbinella massiliensis TaxID=1329796 RepID=UPI0005CB9BA3|nr:hypothetical protein [Risungbinella massiliensis]
MGKKVEIFTAGSYLCDATVKQVQNLVCSHCEVIIYNLNKESVTPQWEDAAKAYSIRSIPTVVLDGKVINIEGLKKK